MTEYSDCITAIKAIIQAQLTEYEQVNYGFGLDFETILSRVSVTDKAIYINYETGSVPGHLVDGSFDYWQDSLSVYLKHSTNILTKTKAFINAIHGNTEFKETNGAIRQISIIDWQPVVDDNQDIMQIRLEVN